MYETLLHTGGAPAPSPAAAGPNADMARTLYPDPAPPPKATAPNADVAALRNADAAQGRGFYSDVSVVGPRNVDEMVLAANPLATREARLQQGTEFASAAVDLGLTGEDVSQLAAFTRGLRSTPMTDEARAANQRAAVTELRARYGDDFDRVFADARALAQLHPKFATFIDATNLGDHPWLIKRMAELGRDARARGRLK